MRKFPHLPKYKNQKGPYHGHHRALSFYHTEGRGGKNERRYYERKKK